MSWRYTSLMDTQVLQTLEAFFSKYTRKKLDTGEILIAAQDEPTGVFFLKEGLVRMYSISLEGGEVTLNVFKPESFFPVSWVINNSKNPYYYEALLPSLVYIAPKKDFLGFLKKDSTILFDLLKRIYKGLDGFFVRMEALMIGNARVRVVTEILIMSRRFGNTNKSGRSTFKVSEKEIAAATGIARETVSREFNKLKKEGLLDFKQGQLTVNGIKKLEDCLFL